MFIFALCFESLRPFSIGFASTGHPCYVGNRLWDECHLGLARERPFCIKIRKFTESPSRIDDNTRKHHEHHRCHRGASCQSVARIGREGQRDLGSDRLGEIWGRGLGCGRTGSGGVRNRARAVSGLWRIQVFSLNFPFTAKFYAQISDTTVNKTIERHHAKATFHSENEPVGAFPGSSSGYQPNDPGNRLGCILAADHRAGLGGNRGVREGTRHVAKRRSSTRFHVKQNSSICTCEGGRTDVWPPLLFL